MVIIISNMRRVGNILDSSKLAILSNKISGSLSRRTKGQYITKSTIDGRTIKMRILQLNPETMKYSSALKNETELLAGRISTYLNSVGVSHDIRVK